MKTEENKVPKRPKVFFSYSWSPEGNADLIMEYARMMMEDHRIDVVLDRWDSDDGESLNVFMERMVKDDSIDRVLIFCNKEYVEKAEKRIGGAGTEGAIISAELYDNLDSKRFIPLFMDRDESGKFIVPTFIKSRKGVNLMEDPELEIERLCRRLWKKPEVAKPELYGFPDYLELPTNSDQIRLKAFFKAKRTTKQTSSQFVPVCNEYTDQVVGEVEGLIMDAYERVNDVESGAIVLKIEANLSVLKRITEEIVELLDLHFKESKDFSYDSFFSVIQHLLNNSLRLLSFPDSLYNPHIFNFLEEVFVFSVATLMKNNCFQGVEMLLGNPFWIEYEFKAADYYYYYQILREPSAYQRANRVFRLVKENPSFNFLSIINNSEQHQSKWIKPLELREADLFIHYVTHVRHHSNWVPYYFFIPSERRELSFIKKLKSADYFDSVVSIYGAEGPEELLRKVLAEKANSNHTYSTSLYMRLESPSRAFSHVEFRSMP